MKRSIHRRLAVLGVLLSTQLLSACIILPRPYLPRPFVPHVVIVEPGHAGSPHGGHHGRRGYGR
ncbi:MAG: hypothetical protein AD742_07685 [Methylibium sp. NZG]|nr:MAG: hypothetical protein AD742_07685 [Methylibium sp. NZG]